MNYAPEIIGLDLFTAPFRSIQTMAAPASSRGTAQSVSESSKLASNPKQEKTTATQSRASAHPLQAADPKPPAEQAEKAKASEPTPGSEQGPQAKPEPSKKELTMDMSDHTVPIEKPLDVSEEARRKAHEASEAKRKAEWEAKQLAKKQKEEAAIQKLQAMTDADAVAASTECVRLAIERITRRNMKECVAGYIQELCQKDPGFARCVMHPRKSLANCFKFINRQAKEYLKNEMEENGIGTEGGGYGGDVPDELCYQWAEDYFRGPDVPEDREKEDKFVQKPYVPAKKKATKKSPAKKGGKKKPETGDSYKQMSLEGID